MEQDIDDGARLLAHGAAVHLKDGSHRVVFDYEALEFLETEFEGLDAFMASMGETRMKQKRLRSIRLGLTAGLMHEKPANQSTEAFQAGVLRLLDPGRLVDYLDAITLAIMEAFPPANEADAAPKVTGSDTSPGNGSTTSPLSATVAQTRSSGA